MDFTVPRTYYTEWWNINTHRCNHISRPPLNQELYGYGRSFIADWARVGSVSISRISENFRIESQMSMNLVGKLHYYHAPIPLLPTHYSSVIPTTAAHLLNDDTTYEQQRQENDDDNEKMKRLVDSSTVRDYGYEQLLNDYILGEQASAAFMQINQNVDEINDREDIVTDAKCKYISNHIIQQLFDMAERGLNKCNSVDEQSKLIKKIQNLIVSSAKSTNSFPASLLPSNNSTASGTNVNAITNYPSTKRRRLTKNSKTTRNNVDIDDDFSGCESEKSEQFLPSTVCKLLYPTNLSLSPCLPSSSSTTTLRRLDNLTLKSDYSRLLASFDPFVIRLASRIVNPNYLGNGLLCSVNSHNYLSSVNHPHMILWCSPQINSFCIGNTLNLLKSDICQSNRFSILPFPLKRLSSRSFCELDACFSESSERIDIVGRLLPTLDSKKSVICMQIKMNDLNLSNSCIENVRLIRVPSGHYTTSICMSRWIPGEWCMTNNYLDENYDRKASIRLYSSGDAQLPMWSGHISLGSYMETMINENSLCLGSTISTSSSTSVKDLIQSDIESYCKYTPRKYLLRQHYPNQHWIRVGFGSYPGELCLTTTRRILIFDTRAASSNAYQLLSTTERQSLFNPNDHITYCPPKWIGDVYILAGGYYSMFLLDKRMPNRTVLHWSHNLAKPLAYLNWTEVSREHQSMYDIPQLLISMTSQYPADMSTFGLNFNSSSGPQYVGPCLSGMPLTNLVSSFHSSNLCRFYNQNPLLTGRLHSSVCGTITYYSPTDMTNQFHTLLLTSHGDLFDYCAYLTSSDINVNDNDVENYRIKSQGTVANWLSELNCRSANKQKYGRYSGEKNIMPSTQSELKIHTGTLDLCNIISERQQEEVRNELSNGSTQANNSTGTSNKNYFTLEHLNMLESLIDSSMESSRWLLRDLKSIWNYNYSDKMKCENQNSLEFTSIFLDNLSDNRMQEEITHQKLITDGNLRKLLDQRLNKLKKLYANDASNKSVNTAGGR
ncbi:TBP associated factor 1C [Schistosoma japonicum]|nr:TBP associated factor 1C [Schistosoma japonicum]